MTPEPDRAPDPGSPSGTGTARARVRPVPVVLGVLAVLLIGLLVWGLTRSGGSGSGAIPVGNHPAGALLSSEPWQEKLPAGLRAWRIVYVTEDGHGTRVAASGVVVTGPRGLDAQAPVLASAHGTTGIAQDCGPSVSPGLFPIKPATPVLPLLEQGWVVVQADYIGLGEPGPDGVHPYLDGASEGHAVLDAVRAAHQLSGLSLSERTLLYGTSQGGHAVLFAGAQAPEYAPGLDLIGVAAAEPATDLRGLLTAFGTSPVGVVVESYLAVAWNAVYPDARVSSQVSDFTAAEQVAATCAGEGGTALLRAREAAPLIADPSGRLLELLERNTPTAPITVPLLVAQGLADPVVSPAVQQRWVEERCAAGQHLEYRTYPGLTHETLAEKDSPFVAYLAKWADARFRGLPATPTC